MFCQCSDKVYYVALLAIHAVVCFLSAGTAVIMGLNRSLTDYKCYLFAREYTMDVDKNTPCVILTYTYAVIGGWSLLSVVFHGLCAFWRKVELCLRVGFGLATVVSLLAWISSLVLTVGFVTWCQWVVNNVTTTVGRYTNVTTTVGCCLTAAEMYDEAYEVTDMETFFCLSVGAQSSGWMVSVLCVCLAIMYLQCCCCKVDRQTDTSIDLKPLITTVS